MSNVRILSVTTSISGFAAVLLGALGAHPLRERLLARAALDAWQTATQYHLAHVVACVGLLAWAAARPGRAKALGRIGWFWQAGCLLFAGSIYVLALGGPRALGPVTPLGGLAFLAGWLLLAVESLRSSRDVGGD
jgi:uncharacterized membrane protein YgdD (TMEM256/DUF423 family)